MAIISLDEMAFFAYLSIIYKDFGIYTPLISMLLCDQLSILYAKR